MSEQILSQEEIDALLGAMAKGEDEFEAEAESQPVVDVQPYDLTSQSVMLRDQFNALEEINDKFSNVLQKYLSTTLQNSLDVQFVSTEMVRFGEFLQGFSNPTSFNIFTMEPLIGSALLVLEPNLVFSLIDCMFGGTGKPVEQEREFTLIEMRMMKKFAVEVLNSMENAWSVVYPIRNLLKKTETKPEFVHLVNPNDLMMIIVFSISGKEFSGNLHICVSYLMLEPIKDKLSTKYIREKDMEHSWDSQIQRLIRDTRVNLTAELGKTVHTIRDLISLQPNDVLKLQTGPQDVVVINVEDVPKYQGYPGIVKGNRAVEISKAIYRNGGA